ncbi:hypothetical protein [Dickeya sp. NCPPB 3274]|uniref:hypothetical protein n=1 Tax=Dickeya sp. NCPPB 3274 TaxID=568766 RepID=UPI0005B4A1F0|nr:hypothetical protein [Dickeya sp. NCPPB 3274]
MQHFGWSLQTANILLKEGFVVGMRIVPSAEKEDSKPWEIHFRTKVGDEAKLLTNGYSDKSRIGTRRFASKESAKTYIAKRLPSGLEYLA